MFIIIVIAIIIIFYIISQSSQSSDGIKSIQSNKNIKLPNELRKHQLLYEDEKQSIYSSKESNMLLHYNKNTQIIQSEYLSHPLGLIKKYYIPNIAQYPNYDSKTAEIVDRFIILKNLFSATHVEYYGLTKNYKNNQVKYFETWSQRWDNSGEVIDEGPDTPIIVFYQKEISSNVDYYSFYLLDDQTLLVVFNLDRTGNDKCAFHLDQDLNVLNYNEKKLQHRDKHALELLKKLILEDRLYP
ncbi:hypothetical protein [Acinetobacter modestus]|uniref:hypothetical protein n=1 Tax=Acinetobacter modestus TaxID=1776740 RepID=UPI003019C903